MLKKQKAAAIVAEFLGTAALTLLILSVQRSTIGVPYFVASAAGLIFALMYYTIGDTSGGYFNPAITIGMWTARKLSTITAFVFIVAQMLGGYLTMFLYRYFSNASLQNVGGHYTARILVAEAVGTAVFAFGYTAAVYKKNTTRGVTSAFVGIALMLGMVAASSAAIGLLNPAVALGIKAWVWGTYVLGPVIGAIIGVNLYDLLFADESQSGNVFKSFAMSSPGSSSTNSVGVAKASTAKKRTSGRKK